MLVEVFVPSMCQPPFVCAQWNEFDKFYLWPTVVRRRIKYRQIPICQQIFRRTGFLLVTIHARLSSQFSIAVDCWPGIPGQNLRTSRKYATSWAAWKTGTNWAEEIEKETLSCRRLFQEMDPPFNIKMCLCHCVIVGCLCRLPNQRRSTPPQFVFTTASARVSNGFVPCFA